jgi:hypothetical protein
MRHTADIEAIHRHERTETIQAPPVEWDTGVGTFA